MIELDGVAIRQGQFHCQDICLNVEKRGYGILMGPTGCGKTSLLEAICGLRRVSAGRILLDGQDVTHQPAARRQIGYVPQDLALFPTMPVAEQIQFGMQVRKLGRTEQRQRTAELAELLGISELLPRYPAGLSGGERQRVALARALSFRPRLLCLDEPLSALDDETRGRMTEQLRQVHETEHVTVLHITHNVREAQELGTVHYQFAQDGIRWVGPDATSKEPA